MPTYDVKYKKRLLAYYDKHGISATVRKFKHDKSVVYRWKRKSETVGFMRKKSKTYSQNEIN